MVKCGNPQCGKPIRVTRDKHYFIKELKERYHMKCLVGSCRKCGKPIFPQDPHKTLPSGGVWHEKCFDPSKKGDIVTITDSSYKAMQAARKAADIPKKLWRDFESKYFKKHKPEFEEDTRAAIRNPEMAFIAIDEALSGKNKNWIEGEIDSGRTPRNFPWHEVGVRGLRDHVDSLRHTVASQKAKDAVLYIISSYDWSLEEFENAIAMAKENENWLYIVPIFVTEHDKAEENARYFAKRMSPRRMTESVELFLQAADVRSNPDASTVYDDDRYMAILRGMPESGNGFRSPEEMFEEERAEHPSLTNEQVWRLVQDHLRETFRGNPLSPEEEAVMPTKDDFPIGVTGIDDFLKWWSYGLTLGLIRWDGKVVEPITAKKFINWWTSGFTLGFLKVEDPLTIDTLDNVGDFLARALSLGLLTWKKGRTSRLTVNPDQLKSIENLIGSAYGDLQDDIGFEEVLSNLGRAAEMLKSSPVDAFRQLEEAASAMSEQIGYEDVHRKISEASERLDRLIRTRNNPPQLKSIENLIGSAYGDLQDDIGFEEVLSNLGRAAEMLKSSPVDAFRQLEEAASAMSEQIGYEDVHRKISEASERLDRLIRTRSNPPQLKLKKMKHEESGDGAKHIRKHLDEIHERMEKVSGKKTAKKNPRRLTKEFWNKHYPDVLKSTRKAHPRWPKERTEKAARGTTAQMWKDMGPKKKAGYEKVRMARETRENPRELDEDAEEAREEREAKKQEGTQKTWMKKLRERYKEVFGEYPPEGMSPYEIEERWRIEYRKTHPPAFTFVKDEKKKNPVRPQAEVEKGYKGMKKEFGLDQVEFLVIDKYERLIEKGTSTREGALTYARNAAMEAGLAPEDVRVVFPDDEPPEVRERLRSFVREMR